MSSFTPYSLPTKGGTQRLFSAVINLLLSTAVLLLLLLISSSFYPIATENKVRYVVTIFNIKNPIPITLEMEKWQHTSWATLFKIYCRSYQVLDNINQSNPTTILAIDDIAAIKETRSRLDDIVLKWIYQSISNELLHMIFQPEVTAQQTWETLAVISSKIISITELST